VDFIRFYGLVLKRKEPGQMYLPRETGEVPVRANKCHKQEIPSRNKPAKLISLQTSYSKPTQRTAKKRKNPTA